MSRGYEALVILRSAGTEQELSRQAAHLEEAIKKLGGTVEQLQSMGRRKLAFRIARQTEGQYYVVRFQAPTAQIPSLDRLFRLNEAVVRFMILTQDEVAPREARSPSGAVTHAAAARS